MIHILVNTFQTETTKAERVCALQSCKYLQGINILLHFLNCSYCKPIKGYSSNEQHFYRAIWISPVTYFNLIAGIYQIISNCDVILPPNTKLVSCNAANSYSTLTQLNEISRKMNFYETWSGEKASNICERFCSTNTKKNLKFQPHSHSAQKLRGWEDIMSLCLSHYWIWDFWSGAKKKKPRVSELALLETLESVWTSELSGEMGWDRGAKTQEQRERRKIQGWCIHWMFFPESPCSVMSSGKDEEGWGAEYLRKNLRTQCPLCLKPHRW